MNSISITVPKTKVNKKTKVFNHTLFTKIAAGFLIAELVFLSVWQIKRSTEGKILPKVTVAGVKVGGKTPDEAKRIVLNYIDTINKQGPTIAYNDQSITSTLPDLGVSFNTDKVVDEAYNYGRDGSVKDKVVENSKIIFLNSNIELKPNVDEAKLNEFLGKVSQAVEKPTQNASLTINNGNITVVPEKQGYGFDRNKLKENIQHAINNNITEKIALETTVLQPTIFVADTANAQKQAETLMSASPISLTTPDNTFTVSKADIGSFIDFKEDGKVLSADISSSKVGSYANRIASKIEVNKVDREVMDGTGQVLNEGRDGLGVDTDGLTKNILAQIKSSNSAAIAIGTFTIAKGQVTINPHAQPGRFPGRYIDVNLSEQTLYAFEGNNLVNQFLISSGKTGPTPTGTFAVYNKTRSQTMSGPGYSLPHVEWISWFTGEYSIHGTYWHNNFGHPMSHGCVNASNGDAEWIYNWDEVGTPVYIHW